MSTKSGEDHFTDCHNLESAITHDKKQIKQHTPFSARDYRTAKAVLHHTLITAVSGTGDYVEGLRRLQNNEFSGDELAAQLGGLFATGGAEFRRVFGRGSDLPSDDAVVLFRWCLKQAGIKLRSRQASDQGQAGDPNNPRPMLYWICSESVAEMLAYAASRQAFLSTGELADQLLDFPEKDNPYGKSSNRAFLDDIRLKQPEIWDQVRQHGQQSSLVEEIPV